VGGGGIDHLRKSRGACIVPSSECTSPRLLLPFTPQPPAPHLPPPAIVVSLLMMCGERYTAFACISTVSTVLNRG
jgi:hypothetical protein